MKLGEKDQLIMESPEYQLDCVKIEDFFINSKISGQHTFFCNSLYEQFSFLNRNTNTNTTHIHSIPLRAILKPHF